ncbi:MAG: peptide chain release factor N(5)-glutamine methyltransferase [Rhodothermia bacterium]|nr:peptide chain release factor N(5)-glutamine methyltransferase [Rhodothermia bacterium]
MEGRTSVGELRKWAARSMDAVPRTEAIREADLMLGHILGVGRAEIIAYPDRNVATDDAEEFRSVVAKRIAGVPVQYILGWAEFYGLRFEVSPAVLIPRPETEILVEQVLDEISAKDNPSVLDVGTGSGCIAVAVARSRPDARVVAVDVSRESIRVAMRNAKRNAVRATFVRADLRNPAFNPRGGPFDVVVSNPPYIHPDEMTSVERRVIEHEPHAALFTKEDPLEYYRLLLSRTETLARSGGALIVEVHADRSREVESLMLRTDSITAVRIVKDLAGRDRIVRGLYSPANSSKDLVR